MRLSPPRKQSVTNVYYERDWQAKLKPRFDAHWSTLPAIRQIEARRVTERNAWVKKQYDAETEAIRESVAATVDENHKEALKQWNNGLKSMNNVGE